MVTLKDVIKMNGDINLWASAMGFKNVRMHVSHKKRFDCLDLVVDETDISLKNNNIFLNSLAALIANKLNCTVVVTLYSAIHSIFKPNIDAWLINLNNVERLTKAFCCELEEVHFVETIVNNSIIFDKFLANGKKILEDHGLLEFYENDPLSVTFEKNQNHSFNFN